MGFSSAQVRDFCSIWNPLLTVLQAFTIITALSFLLLFLHKILSPWIELPRLPEQWLAFRSGLAWTIFKDRVVFSEDMVLDHESGFAIISSDPGLVSWNTLWVGSLDFHLSISPTDLKH